VDVQLNIQPPWLYKKQWNFLNLPRVGEGVHWSHWVGGRGSAKSNTGCQLALDAALRLNPGLPGIWTAPTYQDIHDSFLREWRLIVPAELYRLNESKMRLTLLNGTEIDLRSREKKILGRGPNYAWAIHDEAAANYSESLFSQITAAVRNPRARARFIATLTTPLMNGYQRLAQSDGHTLVTSSSYENPFLPDGYADELARYLSPELADQEIYGRFIMLAGRAWRNYVDELWPNGNRVKVRFDSSRRWYLGVDIGLRSAWLIIQRYQASELGYRTKGDQWIDVVVGEYQPNNEDISRTSQRVLADYGRPAQVFIGADSNTRSIQTGVTASYVFSQVFGQTPIVPITGEWADKQLQFIVASGLLLNTHGERRFCISTELQSHDHTHRGIIETLEQDAFADVPKDGEFMPKDKRSGLGLEDTRDAFLYYCIGAHPPQMALKTKWAA